MSSPRRRARRSSRTANGTKGNHIEHWLNGTRIAEFEVGGPEWNAKYAASKFTKYPNFGKAPKGHIGVQGNHPGMLSLRNIRIRELQ